MAPKDLGIGDIVKSDALDKPKLGYSLPFYKIPLGAYVHNISIQVSKIAKFSRSAGAYSRVKEKTSKYVILELNSGKQKKILLKCYATIGIVSNEFFFMSELKKAGRSR